MTRLSEKLRFSSFLLKPTRFLALVSLSTLSRLCKSLARFLHSQTLPFLSMDSLFATSSSDYFSDDFDSSYSHRRFFRDDDHDIADERVYLLPYKWWNEVEGEADRGEGVVYTVLSDSDSSDSEILLHLSLDESLKKIKDPEVGFSGRQYALVPEGMWLRALKRYNDLNNAENSEEDCLLDLFPLQVRISVSRDSSSLVAKISQKENMVEFYKKACDIFNSAYNPVHIWDFSGQTTQLFLNDNVSLPNDSPRQPAKEVVMELQVHGFSDSVLGNGMDEMISDRAQMECSSSSSSAVMNGSTGKVIPYVATSDHSQGCSYRAVRTLGLTGLQNLGNTCFMNSAIQCLAHTPKLVDFFLGDFRKEINCENPLGMNGELALAFGDLLRKLWVPGQRPVAPRIFKMKLANFAPQFSGYSQHDSQELLAFLLDGLHEDLNRVKRKPYHEVKDADGRPDEEVAEEYWRNHLARNDSIIVDLCQGQFRSTLVCPICKKISITFDPFMYLSLPLPSTTKRTMTVTVMSTDGIELPSRITVTVPEYGTVADLVEALSASCALRDDETLLLAEIYTCKIFRLFEEAASEKLTDIRDQDKLVAYRLKKHNEASPLVVFMHGHSVEEYENKSLENKLVGIPLVTRLSSISYGYDVHTEFLRLMNPFLVQNTEDITDDYDKDDDDDVHEKLNNDDELGGPTSSAALGSDAVSSSGTEDDNFEFYIYSGLRYNKMTPSEPLPVTFSSKGLEVVVSWSDKMINKYDTALLNSLPDVFKPQPFTKRAQESISIYKCLEAFLKEEPLGPEDMWYCPSCKKPQQATKKLDLWRLPETVVIHLKRFSFNRYFKNKLETFVDFPVNDLNFSSYVANGNCQSSNRYVLYAISCHYGGLGGGHYTAFVRYGHEKWYEFDDSRVAPADEEEIKTSAAYVLFYRKV